MKEIISKICICIGALMLAGCAGFVGNAKKGEYAAASLMDGGMKSWAVYYHQATNNPAAFGTTAAEVETRHQQINAVARRISAGMSALDTYLAAYQTNSAVKPWAQAAVDSLAADAPQLVALVAGFSLSTNQFTVLHH